MTIFFQGFRQIKDRFDKDRVILTVVLKYLLRVATPEFQEIRETKLFCMILGSPLGLAVHLQTNRLPAQIPAQIAGQQSIAVTYFQNPTPWWRQLSYGG
jgi:hypothetical protein